MCLNIVECEQNFQMTLLLCGFLFFVLLLCFCPPPNFPYFPNCFTVGVVIPQYLYHCMPLTVVLCGDVIYIYKKYSSSFSLEFLKLVDFLKSTLFVLLFFPFQSSNVFALHAWIHAIDWFQGCFLLQQNAFISVQHKNHVLFYMHRHIPALSQNASHLI